jgi:hypothetical protein
VAGLLREGLDALLPDDVTAWCRLGHDLRPRWKADSVPIEWRRPLLADAIARLYDGQRTEATW